MTDPEGNSEFCFSKTLCKEIVYLTPADTQICRGFKEHDLITCESKVQVASLGS